MKPEIKKEYVELLKTVNQGQRRLKQGDCYCVLGVLCELYIRHNPKLAYWDERDYFVTKEIIFGKEYIVDKKSYPPDSVFDWAGIESYLNSFYLKVKEEDILVNNLNDGNKYLNIESISLKELANLIEKQY